MTPGVNWKNGTWNSGRAGEGNRSTLCIAGDWAPIRAFSPVMENHPDRIYGDLLDCLRSSDLNIFNLESPLCDRGEPVSKSGAVFKGIPRHGEALSVVPVDAVTLANNHVFDYGKAGFDQTLETLKDRGIQWLGAGNTLNAAALPLVLEKNGITMGIVNFSEGEDMTGAAPDAPGVMGWDLDLAERQIQRLKGRVDCILVIAHCGIEYVPYPPPYVVRAFQRMAEAGAHLVAGHHPHVVQGMGWHKGVPLFYSLGNFVFYQPAPLFFRKQGYLLRITADVNGLAGFELIPYHIRDAGLSLLTGTGLAEFFSLFRDLSRPLETDRGLEKTWHALLRYYRERMLDAELAAITEKLAADPPKGAAMLRNRITTLQHSRLLTDTMTRIMEGRLEDSDPDCYRMIAAYMTRSQGQ